MFSVSQIPPVFFMRLAPWFFLFSVVLLVLTYFYGTEIKGSKRWLKIPGAISFQPSELMKLALPIMLARYFQDRHLPPKPRYIFWAIVMISVPVILIGAQPDLGTSLILILTGVFVLFVSGHILAIGFRSIGYWVCLGSRPLVFYERISASENSNFIKSRIGCFGRRLEHYSIQNSNWLRRNLWKRPVSGHTIQFRFSSRNENRLCFGCFRRGIRFFRSYTVACFLLIAYMARCRFSS